MNRGPRRIVVVDYDPRWPATFEVESALIRDAIGQWVLAVEHVGSTAVPRLGAKPIVDIMAGLRELAAADACIELLQTIEYAFVPEATREMPEDRYFEKWSVGVEIAHLHLTEYGSAFWRDHLLFRDFLRLHPEAATEYERLKRWLAPQHTSGYSYSKAKSDFISAALTKARTARHLCG